MDQRALVAAAVAGLFGLGAATGGALAQEKKDTEKCWGIAKAGDNHCASDKGGHSCAGQSKVDYDPNEFKNVKTGTCLQLGGSLTPGQPGKLAKEKKG